MLVLAALGLPAAPSAADDASALLGNWRVPPFEQQRMRMSEQCQRNADTNVQNVAESEVEVFSCDDPKFAAEKARILDFVRAVNPIYRAEGHPPVFRNHHRPVRNGARLAVRAHAGHLQSEPETSLGADPRASGDLEHPQDG